MAGLTPILIKSFLAGAAIPARTQVKFAGADDTVIACAAAADFSVGVTTDLPVIAGETVDVIMLGIGECILGAAVTRGALVTSDATGRAITAAAAAGVNVRSIGLAAASGVLGDIVPLAVSPCSFQG